MATSAIPFFYHKWLKSLLIFLILSTVFRHLQNCWDSQFLLIFPPLLSPFFSLWKQLTGGGKRLSWQCPWASPLRQKRRWKERSIPVRERVTVWLARALRRPFWAGHRSSKTLTSHPSLRNGVGNIFFQFLSSVDFSLTFPFFSSLYSLPSHC